MLLIVGVLFLVDDKSNKNSFSLIGRKQQLDDAQYEINSLEISLKENTKIIDTLVNNLEKLEKNYY